MPTPEAHSIPTAEEIFADVVEAAKQRAEGGCGTLRFECPFSTENYKDWAEQRVLVEAVAERLRGEKVEVQIQPEGFPDYLERHGERWHPRTGHTLVLDWR